jgi:alkyldihydroxyacetonephosphate synthase
MLRDVLGAAEPAERVSIEQVGLPEARPIPDSVVATVGADAVLDSTEQRIRRAAGKSYPDLVRMREGRLPAAPDAVVMPADRLSSSRRCSRPAPVSASPWSRSAAAPASSAASTPTPDRTTA